ncbi:hypothetical protein WJX74_005036 [Apatococcus lobatus]|uniref:Uncharacterized protein n=1 Tax=Apatococcus lobatus TaxID=904363 RepID=A0AAW1RY38_9CHLO
MCVAFLLLDSHPDLSFLLAFNRDEYLARPTQPAHWWPEHPDILASKDLQGGGTWLGLSRKGKFALLTNVREVDFAKVKDAASRGGLPVAFLTSSQSPLDFLGNIKKQEYNGFNMVVGDLCTSEVGYVTNRGQHQQPIPLQPGLHGISNGSSLQQEWTKVQRGKSILQDILGLQKPLDSSQSHSNPPANSSMTRISSSGASILSESEQTEDQDLDPASSSAAQRSAMQEPSHVPTESHQHGHKQTASQPPAVNKVDNVLMSSSALTSQQDSQSGAKHEQEISQEPILTQAHDLVHQGASDQARAAAEDSCCKSSISKCYPVPWNDILTKLMQDSTTIVDDSQLPQTGMPEQIERNLSPIFIRSHAMPGGAYGTRTQTVIAAWHDGHAALLESNLIPDGSWVQQKYDFGIRKS